MRGEEFLLILLFVWFAFSALVIFLKRCIFGSPNRPRASANTQPPAWFLPAGIIALILATLGFLSCAAFWGGGDLFGSILAGALNPLFFIGLPLGIYWLNQYGKRSIHAATPPSTTATLLSAGNAKLTHCADCGGHVSRRAGTCPHCGAPLDIEAKI